MSPVKQYERFQMPTAVSIFCGCGGLDIGFHEHGFDIVYACDFDEQAVDCYRRNVDLRAAVRDVTSEVFHSDVNNVGSCDIVLGGFPCQGFSKAGPKNVADPRNNLYREMIHVVRRLRPRLFIAENVDGLSQNFKGGFLSRIIADFREIGYEVEHRILDAAAYGVPQHRRRILFAGYPAFSFSGGFPWPDPSHAARQRNGEFKIAASRSGRSLFDERRKGTRGNLLPVNTVRNAIGGLIDISEAVPDHAVAKSWPQKYDAVFNMIGEGQKLCNVRHARTSVYTWQIPEVFGTVSSREIGVLETISKHRRHKRYGSIPNGNPLPVAEIGRLAGLERIEPELQALLAKGYVKELDGGYDLKGAMFCSGLFKRPDWDEPAPTVLTNFHNPRYFLHPSENRPFSLRECARLQTFPDSFRITGGESRVDLISGYRLVGNAVPPLLASAIAGAAAEFLAPVKSVIEVAS